ncbi:MAG TPA: hypothetical protein VIF12_02800, partial [Micavibrio sp.]
LDVDGRRLSLDIDEAEMKKRSDALRITATPVHSPWGIIHGHPDIGVHQAHLGAYLKLFDDPALAPAEIAKRMKAPLRRQH